MELRESWNRYKEETVFNYSVLPEYLKARGEHLEVPPKNLIVSGGEFPRYIYFILEGVVAGIREYSDGNEYSYFQLDKNNGSIGLLEIFARKSSYIATIVSVTKVELVRMEAAEIYDEVMKNAQLMRRCISLLADDLYKRSGNDGILYYFQGIDRVRYFLTNYYEVHRNEKQSGKVIVFAEYQEIANNIGVSVRTVGRNIQKLKENQEIGSFRKKITLTEKQYRELLKKLYL